MYLKVSLNQLGGALCMWRERSGWNLFHVNITICPQKVGAMTMARKEKFGNKCILSYYVPVQTIVSPYDANCVTQLIYSTTDLYFLFWILVSFDLSCFFFVTFTQPFYKRHHPTIGYYRNKARLFIVTRTRLYILLSFIEIIKAWPLCILWTREYAYLLTQLYKIKMFG